MNRPKIVCLIGSVKFREHFKRVEIELSFAGNIVLTPVFMASTVQLTASGRAAMKALHRAKIALADEVLVINYGGYVGEDTIDETTYAGSIGKPIELMEHRAVRT